MSKPPLDRRRLALRVVLGLAITGGLFAVLLGFVEPAAVARELASPRWGYTLAGLGLWVGMYLVRTLRFVALAPRTPYLTMLAIASVHNFFLRLLPMRTGELSYAFLVRRAGTAGVGESLLGLLLLRLLDATMVVVLFAVTLVFDRTVYLGDRRTGITVALVGAAVGTLLVVGLIPLLRLGQRTLERLARATGLTRRPAVEKLLGRLAGAVASFSAIRPRVVLWVSALSVVLWLLTFTAFFAIMRGFSMPVSWPQTVLGSTTAVVTGFLPVSGIGSFGTMEAGWALGFSLVGLEQQKAVASGFGVSLTTFGYCAVLGLLGWIGLTLIGRRARREKGKH